MINDLPLLIAFGSLKGANKKDVEAKCRGFIESYFESPANCFFFYKKVGDVTYYEIQEGGNQKAYLPSIIKFLKLDKEANLSEEISLDDDGDETEDLTKPESVYAYVPSARRMAYVERKADHISFGIATADMSSRIEPTKELKRTAKMIPYKNESNGMLTVGIASFMMGFATLISAYIVKINSSEIIIDNRTNHLRELSKQINDIENIKSVLPSNYIKKLEFVDGEWSKKTGNILIENDLKKEQEIIDNATNDGDEEPTDSVDDKKVEVGDKVPLPEGIEVDVEEDLAPPPPPMRRKKVETGGTVDTFKDAQESPRSEVAKDNKLPEEPQGKDTEQSNEDAPSSGEEAVIDANSNVPDQVTTDSGDKITVVIEENDKPETIEEIRKSIDEEKEAEEKEEEDNG